MEKSRISFVRRDSKTYRGRGFEKSSILRRPDEYTGSEDTYSLKGTLAKAKANAAQGLGAMIEIATDGEHTPNRKEKHNIDAANGWYKYTTRFALPVYGQDGNIERYNVFRGFMIIRYDQDGKKYLYDVIKIKKETSNPPSC